MRIFARKRYSRVTILLMAFILTLGTVIPSFATYAAEEVLKPTAPQNLKVNIESITATTATVTWDVYSNPDINDIDIWNADNNAYVTWGNSGSRTLDNLKPETTYKFYITWFERPALREHKSNIIEFTTPAGEVKPPLVPPKDNGPRDLKVKNVTHNTVSLEWIPVKDFTAYWIWDSNNKYIDWANNGAKVVGGLQPETEYSLYVGYDGIQAANLTPEQKSNVVKFKTLADTSIYPDAPLTAPSYLKVTAVTDGSATLNWGASPLANGYDVYVNGSWKGGTWDNSTTTKIIEGLELGTTYTFEVKAQKAEAGQATIVSAASNKVTINWGELEAPKDLNVVTATRGTVSLGWAPSPGATSYDIYKDGKRLESIDSNQYVASGLKEGTSYVYKVVAKNNLWISAPSADLKAVPGSNYNMVSYYTSWSVNEEARNFKPTDIDVSQLTHINYAFSDLCWKGFGTGAAACQQADIPLQKDYVFDGEMIIGDPEVDFDNFKSFATIREQNPHLKIMISVGGWTWSKNFSNMAATEVTRRAFANSVVDFLREYRLDGIDIDWEYPVEGGVLDNSRSPLDKENFTLLVKTVREALDAAGSVDGKYYLQTIASGQGDNFTVNADFINSVKYLDFVNIMTYDYSGRTDSIAHHNSPLYFDKNHPAADTYAPRNNVLGGAIGHRIGGVPSYKLVLGVPFYGKGWMDCSANGEYQTCKGADIGTWEAAIFDYTDIENNYLNKNGYVRYWNEAAKVAYVYNPETKVFISYNDKETMTYTAALLRWMDIAGVMSWDISGDRNKTLTTELVKNLPIDGTVNTSILATPENLVLTSNTQNSIEVNWDATPGATGYEVYNRNQWVANTTEPQYTLSSLTPSTRFYIHVVATVKDNDEVQKVSMFSNVLEGTTLDEEGNPPTEVGPKDLKAVSVTHNSVSLEWTPIPGVADYWIWDSNNKLITTGSGGAKVVGDLKPETQYSVYVGKAGIEASDLTPEQKSNVVTFKTLSQPPVVTPTAPSPSGGGSTPSTPTTPTTPPVVKLKDQLDILTSKDGDKLIVKLQSASSLAIIGKATSTTFPIVVSDKGKQVEVNVPKEILAAIAKKGDQASLSILANGVEYIIPIHAIDLSKDIKITIQAPVQNINDQLSKLLQDNGMKQLVNPLEFKIEQLNADKTFVEIKDFGKHFLVRKFILKAKDIDVDRATGVIYIPGTNEIRSVPTVFTVNTDGTVTAELKRPGNSIYTIIETKYNFQDVTTGWAQKDVTLATAKLIATGESKDKFGTNSSITRAEVTSMIARALGLIPNEANVTFKDVDSQSKFARDIGAASLAGFIKGKTSDSFGPNDKVTRQDMAIILANAMEYAGKKHKVNLGVLSPFKDQSTISSYAKDSLALMVDYKIMQGMSPTQLDPKSNVTKAQATVTVMRMLRTLGLSN